MFIDAAFRLGALFGFEVEGGVERWFHSLQYFPFLLAAPCPEVKSKEARREVFGLCAVEHVSMHTERVPKFAATILFEIVHLLGFYLFRWACPSCARPCDARSSSFSSVSSARFIFQGITGQYANCICTLG